MNRALDTMPTEVVQEIAVNLEIDGCLALSQTCRSLRAATLDALLLKKVIGSQHTLWNFHSINLIRIAQRLHYDARILQRYKYYALDQDRLGRWDKFAFNRAVQTSFGLSLPVWTRYAVADLKAFRLCSELNTQVDADGCGKFGFASERAFGQAMRYLPHILVLKRESNGLHQPHAALRSINPSLQIQAFTPLALRLQWPYKSCNLSRLNLTRWFLIAWRSHTALPCSARTHRKHPCLVRHRLAPP